MTLHDLPTIKVLFVGPDGSYKTTVATKLHQYLDIPYAKYSQSRDLAEVIQKTVDLAIDQNFDSCVIDRIKTVDHIVYGTVIGKESFGTYELTRMHEAQKVLESSATHFITVYLYGSPDVLWGRLAIRGDEDYITKEHLQPIMDTYEQVFAYYQSCGDMKNIIRVSTDSRTSEEVFKLVLEAIEECV